MKSVVNYYHVLLCTAKLLSCNYIVNWWTKFATSKPIFCVDGKVLELGPVLSVK